jgi:5-methylcytosine-specific restriction protein A
MARRAAWLRRNPLCTKCLVSGVVRAADEVDHVVPLFKGGADHESNFDSLCVEHHKEKTARDKGARAAVGVDGWPIE